MCGGPKWKREVVPDHKFDFVDTREFSDNGFMMRMKYMWLYIIVLKSFLVYVSDIFSAITMLSTNNWSNEIFKECQNIDGCFFIPFDTGKWLFVGCIIFSFLLLAYESRKAKKIIASRDISYAFTNVMANNYYSLRSYDHFCFFDHISNSTKVSDDFAFFVFFVFKSWKRLLLADGPRQTINALTLYAVWLSRKDYPGPWYDVAKYFQGNSLSTSALTVTSFFTVVVFAGSLLLLTIAAICYIPLLCHIRGNLKEYCCHKVDKRIGDVIKRRQKQRLADAVRLAQKEARGDFSHLKNKKGELIAQPLPQPTLPNLSVDDDDDTSSMNTRAPAPSTYTQDYYHYQADKGSADYPPPMPAYNPYSAHQAPGSYAHFNPSTTTFGYDDQQPIYDDDTESLARLTTSAAPFSHQPANPYQHVGQSPYGQSHGVGLSYDPHDVYEGRVDPVQPPARQWSPHASIASGLAYDDSPDPSHYPPAQSLQNRSDDPYGGYSSNPGTPQQSQNGGRDYDGRGQSRVV
ncbi:hypothetical protein K443DRAFT_674096 [Laccaria amethystina LaAM-08-1]|jgi:hypothetical protein|uniref:Vacuole protein n=1 Tax=Laccaria amethystina LaAM-08-1 TaxID=1095629 RepID=A0A0C9XYN3_9AGAR|nr:hypothetical protein K443DRAFT_674096 [Laccaria amethystina LaAM-08-1]